MKIPYGQCNFEEIREQGQFYADKTVYLPLMEDSGRYGKFQLFLRPRRFGKSTLIHMLRYYYDINLKDRFERLFKGLYIYDHPTPKQGRYLVLYFDFSSVATDEGKEEMRRSFDGLVRMQCMAFARAYEALHPVFVEMQGLLRPELSAASAVTILLGMVQTTPFKVLLLIDEYDNFAHALLTKEAGKLREQLRREYEAEHRSTGTLYSEAFFGTGFVKNFYKVMKTFSGVCLERAFITGVTPIVLDDMASGFNVVTHLTLMPEFHALAGLTHADVALAAEQFSTAFPECGSQAELLRELLDNYDHYRFSLRVDETLFNPDMVFYYFQQLASEKRPPLELLDHNCRTDYDKLRLIAQPPEQTDDSYLESLTEMLKTERATGRLLTSFSAYHMHSTLTLPSLLFYMGLLTLEGEVLAGIRFRIPNRVIKQLHWQEFYELLIRRRNIKTNIPNVLEALGEMSWNGQLQPLVDLVQRHVLDVLSSRDLTHMNEEVVKVLFTGYIVLGDVFNVLSELELSPGGYADLFLGLDRRHPQARWGWVLEFKYLKASASKAQIQAAQKQARAQLERYLE
ncbi:MAG: AAA family ATPase, partial [Myxococcota bacterium]